MHECTCVMMWTIKLGEEETMADAAPSIFNKKATEKLRSPDDLEEYVRITNPSVWLVLGAITVLLLGLLSWGVFGAVTSSIKVMGTVVDRTPLCMLSADEIAEVSVGDDASVGPAKLQVKYISKVPVSRDEAKKILENDYLVSALMKDDWCYLVYLQSEDKLDVTPGTPMTVNITTERVAPITLIFE